ncbi:O-antigen ligase family protein [Microbacterium sp. 179-I 3D2 NHS]|uniref:O-antigen ligase family protein n=1 Tax=Microbacterium sp. 179-I 3D2 NHS TaxID=3235178 RepID=UPI00399FB019
MTSTNTTRRRPAASARQRQRLGVGEDGALPAWPVLVFLWGYPIFWMLGLLLFALVIMAVPMLAFLIMRRRLFVAPGVLPWAGYALWMIPCMLMIDTLGRFVSTGVQLSQFIALAIAMVYIVNARESLTPARIFNGLTYIWIFVIIGGYLGMLFPEVRLTMTIGQLLPSVLSDNDYVRELVYPNLAEVQTPWGAEEPFVRPSAPFAYTNGWGSAIAVLTPIAIGTAIGHRTARAIWLLVIAVIAAVPPAVATTNRGLFLGLAVGVVYVVIRLAMLGKWLATIWVTILGLAVSAVLVMSGFLDGIMARQEVSDTTEGRGNLYVETFERALASPILGYGAPRPSFFSEISVGTQGAIWNTMFSFGFVGLALFAAALLTGVFRTFNAPNLSTLWIHTSIVVATVLSLFYGLDRQLVFVCLAVAVLLREKYLGPSDYWSPEPLPFRMTKRAG